MPTDQETLNAFVRPAEPSTMIAEEAREQMARLAHEAYRRKQEKRYLQQHPPMLDWDSLKETYRHSNLAQVDHIETKLRRIGLAIRKVSKEKATLFEFSEEQKLCLAEIEHGRWNAERLLEGWKYGPVKNEEKKETPYIVAWHDLSEEVKNWDRQAIEEIPQQLATVGYEIYDPNQ